MNNKAIGGIGSVLLTLVVILGIGARFARVINRNVDRSATQQGLSSSDRKHLQKMGKIKKDVLASSERDKPFLARRASFKTKLNRQDKAPSDWESEPLIEGLELVTYESNGVKLKAALYVPPNLGNEKRPALVYYHGGFALYYGSIHICQPFINNDFIIMMPMMRGENGGNGHYEMFVGELDDAANAIRWLSKHKNVDGNHIYAFGHSIGGGISAMMSLMDESLPLKHSGSSGGLYGPESFYAWQHIYADSEDIVRFDSENVNECLMRVLQGNVKWMNRKHYAYIGTQDDPFRETLSDMRQESASAPDRTRLTFAQPHGDHMTSLEPAIEQYHTIVMADLKRAGIPDEAASASGGMSTAQLPTGQPTQGQSRRSPGGPPTSFTPSQPRTQSPTQQRSGGSLLDRMTPNAPPKPTVPENATSAMPSTNSTRSTRSNADAKTADRKTANNKTRATSVFRRDSSENLYPRRNQNIEGFSEINNVDEELGHSFGDRFSEPVPGHGYLVGFEISTKQRHEHGDPEMVSVQPLYRAKEGDKQGKGKLYGEKGDKVERAFAPKGYAVGGLRGKAHGSVRGFELVFMKIRADGTLDLNDLQVSPWIGEDDDTPFYAVIDGDGQPVTTFSGSIFMKHVNSIKLEFE